jgi:arginase
MIKLLGIPFDENSLFLKGSALASPRIRLMETDGSANSFCESGTTIINGQHYADLVQE